MSARILAGGVFVLALAVPASSLAQGPERGFYVGVASPLGLPTATFDKTVDNTDPETLAPPPRAGTTFQEVDTGSGNVTGVGLLLGYRWPLAGSPLGLAAEVDLSTNGGAASGRFDGIGDSPDRNELGELWPDAWSYEPGARAGVTLRVEGMPGAFRSQGLRLFALAGLHRTTATVTTEFHGCLDPVPCGGAGLSSGTDPRDAVLYGWSAGVGVEKFLAGRLAVAAEARYADDGEASWVADFSDVKITVPSVVTASGISLRATLVIHLGAGF